MGLLANALYTLAMPRTFTVQADCPIMQCCPIQQHIADLGKMNLSNCVKFVNLTLNSTVGAINNGIFLFCTFLHYNIF